MDTFMQLIDTHAHLYLEDFDDDLEQTIQRSINKQVDNIILPNIDSSTFQRLHRLTDRFPENCVPLMGLHPTHVKESYETELEKVLSRFDLYDYKGIGEIGIDLYWDKTFLREQIIVFERQLALAVTKNLPVVIHARDSFDEIFQSILKTQFAGLRGIFHAFTGTRGQAELVIAKGFKIGIGGIVTFKNSHLSEVVQSIDLDHIVLETDSPYLAPVPYRGKRNESSYIRIIAEKVAEIKGISIEEVAERTTKNAIELFNL